MGKKHYLVQVEISPNKKYLIAPVRGRLSDNEMQLFVDAWKQFIKNPGSSMMLASYPLKIEEIKPKTIPREGQDEDS